MRIISEMDKEGLKITIFIMNGKISIKFERDLLEQTYKFRDGSQVVDLESAIAYIDAELLKEIRTIFSSMSELRYQKSKSLLTSDDTSSYDYII
ncbi:MAG: hypothetical protein WAT79_15785 [Saprospiraceae bacterium]